MLDVDVPRVPAARVVIVKLEHVARPAQHLAAGFLVPDRGDDAIVVELDPKEFVLHGSIRVGRPVANDCIAVSGRARPRVRGRVEDREAVAIADQGILCMRD